MKRPYQQKAVSMKMTLKKWMDERLSSHKFGGTGNHPGNKNVTGTLGSELLVKVRSSPLLVPVGTEFCIFRPLDDKKPDIAVTFFFEDAVVNVYQDSHAIRTPHPQSFGTH